MSTASKKVIGYVRVSTEEQNRHGQGMDIQREAIINYCKAMGWDLIEIVEEPAESGASVKKRLKLQGIIERMGDGEFEGVIVTKLDRLARNLKELLILHDDEFDAKGCAIISIKEQFDTSTAMGRLFFQIIGGFAEFERSVITERTMDGIDHKAENGQHATGSIPTGYRKTTIDGKKAIEVDESEAQIIQLIFHLRDEQKMSFYDIADYLNEKGYKPKRSKTGLWRNTTVNYIYNNPKYKGNVTLHRYGQLVAAAYNEDLRIL